MAGERCEIDRDILVEEHIQRIAVRISWIGSYGDQIVPVFQQLFAEQEAGGEFLVVAGRAHGDGDGAGFHLDLERFLHGQGV